VADAHSNQRLSILLLLFCLTTLISPHLYQIDAAREQARLGGGGFRSNISGIVIPVNEVAVDHTPPNTFKAILEAFLDEEGIDLHDVGLRQLEESSMLTVPALDDDTLQRWFDFHQQRATLRIISKAENAALNLQNQQMGS